MTSMLQDGNVKGAIRVLLADDKIAEINPRTVESLRDKHPPAPEDCNFPAPPDDTAHATAVSPAELMSATFSFPPGSAGGVFGLRPQHLKDLLGRKDDTQSELCLALTDLATMLLRKDVPEDIRPFLFGANLIPLLKKDGGIRPIAVGDTLRSLWSKIVSRRCADEAAAMFTSSQLGFGIRGGAEAAVHAVRNYVEEVHNDARVIVKLDFRNAFNTLRRDVLLSTIKSHFPAYYRYFWQCYRHPSRLSCGSYQISSETGVQQGDPNGPFGYSLATLPLFDDLDCDIAIGFLDDVTLAGPAEKVIAAIRLIITRGFSMGLELNLDKCEVYGVGRFSADRQHAVQSVLNVWPNMRVTGEDDFVLLGSPLTSAACVTFLKSITAQLKEFLGRLKEIPAHFSLYLLKHCLLIPKLLYGFRTSRCYEHMALTDVMDECVRVGMQSILNIRATDLQWSQMTLPVRDGGLGLRTTKALVFPAFLASAFSVVSLVSEIYQPATVALLDSVVEEWSKWSNCKPPSEESRKFQWAWDRPSIDCVVSSLKAAAVNETDKAVLLAALQRDSGAWLNALPAPALHTFLRDEEVRVGIALRFGLPVVEEHDCVNCGSRVETNGHHGLSCPSSKGRWSRHVELNNETKRGLELAGYPCQSEPAGLSDKDGKRPDGMTLIPVREGKAVVWDATCWDTVAVSHVHASSLKAGSVAQLAENFKRRKYAFVEGLGYFFYALAVETFGTFGTSFAELIRFVGRKIRDATGEPRSTAFLRQRLSLAVVRGNAAAVLGTLSAHHKILNDNNDYGCFFNV
ncbi:uncharacterized protein LOC129586997 [Paramacrobiotus metropolitanus]|uniref:uncharacterized protein LOC129586997 n=1 Tax=Paramacrobiotus metropolitanus TaxID=2943436 RepID=UPI002446272F|nr:uncharacterized protein LOC129586997 [Paramacrobiotus metropolitanus]